MEVRIELTAEEIIEFALRKAIDKGIAFPCDRTNSKVLVDCTSEGITETFNGTQEVATVVFTC